METKRIYGWKPDKPDPRDYKLTFGRAVLPNEIDLRGVDTPILDQGQLGSCTGNGIAGVISFDMKKQKISFADKSILPSRLFIYYNERVLEGTVNEDSGAAIRDGIKTINTLGVPSENTWVYDISKFAVKPSEAAYTEALKHKSVAYHSLSNDLFSLKSCLAQGYPIVFGMQVFDSFESEETAKTGVVHVPNTKDTSIGGHCMKLVGYSDKKTSFIVANSWGTSWGDKGYCYIPYKYITSNLSGDFWTITIMA